MRNYVLMAGGLPALLTVAAACFNYAADPYLMHQWDTPRLALLRPAVEKMNAWGKAYALARYRPETVYLGNSRTELGLPADGSQRVFNAALSGSTVGDAIKMLRHVVAVAPVQRIVWGIDASSFSLAVGNSDIEPDMLADGAHYLAHRVLSDLRRSVSLEMTRDSLALLHGQTAPVCRSSLYSFGQRDGNCLAKRLQEWGGTAEVMQVRTEQFLQGPGPQADAMEALESVLRQHCGLHVDLYINPTHAVTIDAWYQAGRGAAYESWLTGLAASAARLRKAGCEVRVFDFSGFNAVTSEAVPPHGSRNDMQNFWEASHYRANVGAMILQRLSGGALTFPGFGEELLPATIAAHVAGLRAARLLFEQAYPDEAQMATRASRNTRNIPPRGTPATCCTPG